MKCDECKKPLNHPGKTRRVSPVVIQFPTGAVRTGFYDGFRTTFLEDPSGWSVECTMLDNMKVWHRRCYETDESK